MVYLNVIFLNSIYQKLYHLLIGNLQSSFIVDKISQDFEESSYTIKPLPDINLFLNVCRFDGSEDVFFNLGLCLMY